MIGDGSGRGRLGAGVDAAVESRLPFVGALIVLVFLIFFVRLFQLQLVEGEKLGVLSKNNSVRTMRLEAPRGDIVDREGRILATTRPAFGVQVVPQDLRRRSQTFGALGQLLDEDATLLDSLVGQPRGRGRFRPVRLAGDLPWDQKARIDAHLFALPGVFPDVRPRRDYVSGDLAAHLLGTIGEVSKEELSTRAFADYRAGEVVGKAGVEKLLESHLRGRTGGRNEVVDVAGRLIKVLDEVEPRKGGRVRLTLDLDLQRAAEEAFRPKVLGERAKMGAVVAIDPRNGDLLALVSRPSFDPNSFAGGIDPATWKQLTGDEWRPIQNRAVSGHYPPGSTYKVFVAAAGLQEGLVDPHETVYCPGHFRLGRRTYRCWKREGHGPMNLRDALKKSCDVYFYQLGLKLGIDRLAYFARGFNLGRRTGVRLPNEDAGLVPTKSWKENRFAEPWVRGETVSAAIGQGYNLVTPIQLAVAYAALANGGALVRPRLLLEASDAEGSVSTGPAPEFQGKVPVAKEHLDRVIDALEAVVGEDGGTARRARVRGVRVAGKTGTSQVVRLKHTEDLEEDEVPLKFRDHAWFVGFAPVDAPEIVVVALGEHGGHGSTGAAPVVQAVLQRYFETRGVIEPAKPAKPAEPAAPPAAAPAEAPPALEEAVEEGIQAGAEGAASPRDAAEIARRGGDDVRD